MTQILKLTIPFCKSSVQALAVVPDAVNPASIALFSHGYTSHKGSVLNWALKLADNKIASLVFDLPGHYLGSFNEVETFDDFKNHSSDLFIEAARLLISKLKETPKNIILGGHSLGGLLSIKALDHEYFQQFETTSAVTVGVGLPKGIIKHVLQGPFFESMLRQRSSLVSPAINPETMFNWIGEEKAGIQTSQKNIHLISGQDDFIAPPANLENFKNVLIENQNNVTIEIKKNLPHHLPELAAGIIKNYFKNQGFL